MTEVLVFGVAILVVVIFAMMCFGNLKRLKKDAIPPDAGYQEATKVVEDQFDIETDEIDNIVSGPTPENELAARINRRKGPL